MAYRVYSAPTNHWGSQRFYRETPFSTKIKTTSGPDVLLTKKLNTRMRLTEPLEELILPSRPHRIQQLTFQEFREAEERQKDVGLCLDYRIPSTSRTECCFC